MRSHGGVNQIGLLRLCYFLVEAPNPCLGDRERLGCGIEHESRNCGKLSLEEGEGVWRSFIHYRFPCRGLGSHGDRQASVGLIEMLDCSGIERGCAYRRARCADPGLPPKRLLWPFPAPEGQPPTYPVVAGEPANPRMRGKVDRQRRARPAHPTKAAESQSLGCACYRGSSRRPARGRRLKDCCRRVGSGGEKPCGEVSAVRRERPAKLPTSTPMTVTR